MDMKRLTPLHVMLKIHAQQAKIQYLMRVIQRLHEGEITTWKE